MLKRFVVLLREERSRFPLALLLSLSFHALVLAIKLATPVWHPQPQARSNERLDVTIETHQAKRQPQRLRDSQPHVLAIPRHNQRPVEVPQKTWSIAERDEMNQFLDELAEENKPLSGKALAQRALAMARIMRSPEPSLENEESRAIMQRLIDAKVDPFSIELYFDALFKKMNRSAAMIGNDNRSRGVRTAAVRVMLKPDGSVKSFEILRVADQQSEIAFIKAVVEQASPFPVFPADINKATNTISLLICIRPGESGSGGAMFSRMSDGQACR